MYVLSCAYLYTYLHLCRSYLFIFVRLRSHIQSSGIMLRHFVCRRLFALDNLFVFVLFVHVNPPVCVCVCVCVCMCVCVCVCVCD